MSRGWELKRGQDYADIKLFAELSRIEKALVEKHSVAEALAWCGENRGTLQKTAVSISLVAWSYGRSHAL